MFSIFFQKKWACPVQHPETKSRSIFIQSVKTNQRKKLKLKLSNINNNNTHSSSSSNSKRWDLKTARKQTTHPGSELLPEVRLLLPRVLPRPRADASRQRRSPTSGPEVLAEVRDVQRILPERDVRRTSQGEESLPPDPVDEEAGQLVLQLQQVVQRGQVICRLRLC